jgi:hypothetical protein
MVNEVTDVLTAKINPHCDAGIRMFGIPVSEWDVDHIEELLFQGRYRVAAVYLKVVLREHHEVSLMDMELVILLRAVLDCPILDRTLRGGDRGRIVRRKCDRRLPVDSYKKIRFVF